MIANYEHPYHDEHLVGWLYRLSEMNGLDMKNFIKLNLPYIRWEHSVDTIGNLSMLEWVDPYVLFRYNTMYYTLFPFLKEGMQAKILHRFLYGGNIHWYHTVSAMRFCPECIKDDIENKREPYYRVWHQLDEVYTCAKHGVCLWAMQKTGRLNNPQNICNAHEIQIQDVDISEYIYEMYSHPVSSCVEKWISQCDQLSLSKHTRKEIIRAGREIGIKNEENYFYYKKAPCRICGMSFVAHSFFHRTLGVCPVCENQLSGQELINIRSGLKTEYYLNGQYVYHKCGRRLSGGVHDFIWGHKECSCTYLPGIEKYKKEFDDDEFVVVDFKRERINSGRARLKIRHLPCGHTFDIGRSDFKSRRYCRVCNSYEWNFRKQFEAMVGMEYELLEVPESSAHMIKAKHSICGFEFQMRARNFLEGQRCPFCQKNIGYDKLIDILQKNADLEGYTISKKGADIVVTLPDKRTKTMRVAFAVQEMTRLDNPEYFARIHRIEPIISDKAKIYLHMKKYANQEGIYIGNKELQEQCGINRNNFFSSLQYLKKEGNLKIISKGVYKIKAK